MSQTPNIQYHVSMPQPQTHLFHVTLEIDNWQEDELNIKMPVWTPGSYLVREYARHVQNLSVSDSLACVKNAKNSFDYQDI